MHFLACLARQVVRRLISLKTVMDDPASHGHRGTTGDTTWATFVLTGESFFKQPTMTGKSTGEPKSNDRRADRRINSPAAWN
jgi:hypothetical protein